MTASADYRPERLGALDCLTSGAESWLDDCWLQVLSVARNGLTVTILHRCKHRETYQLAEPAMMRHYASQNCTRCLLKGLLA